MIPCGRVRVLLITALTVSLAGTTARAVPTQRGDRQVGRLNTWSASSRTGLSLAGTWTGGVDPKTGAASGSWTLLDATGQPAMSGGWSASKTPNGWSGSWRANAVGSRAEYAGTWSATVDLKPNASFADLFAMAAQKIVSGTWNAGRNSGSWSIRAFSSN
jgi:hypothetical protein